MKTHRSSNLMRAFRLSLGVLALSFGSSLAFGASPCPTIGHSTFQGDNQAYLTAGGGCNTLVTVAANGSVSITTSNSSPYDGSDDTLVGVVNNSSTPLTTLTITGSGISGFEGDGICAFGAGGTAGDTFTSGSSAYCTSAQLSGTDPGDYAGPNQVFSNFSSGNSLTVTFTTPVPANGGTTFFSLEEPPSTAWL